jgi:hypothetical protein
MSDNGGDSDDDYMLDDEEYAELGEDVILDEVDDSANITKEEEPEEIEEEEEEDPDDEIITGVYTDRLRKITEYERTKIISTLAQSIDDSKIIVPERFEGIIDCSSGCSKIIALNWFNKRHVAPLPIDIYRSSRGKTARRINPAKLLSRDQLGFHDLGF